MRRPSTKPSATRTTPDISLSAPGRGASTGDFWKRSGQHEPRKAPRHGAPFNEAVCNQDPAPKPHRPAI